VERRSSSDPATAVATTQRGVRGINRTLLQQLLKKYSIDRSRYRQDS
jgi:hypothetical protein